MTVRDAPDAPPVDETDTKVEVASGNAYHVTLPVFEGPLDLLLHLIQKHELDIFDIPVSFITQKYLEYLSLMQELQIDVASEYLVMAATLAHIKSKSLLPTESTESEEDAELDEQDPRGELIRRLLEYQKYKDAAERLNERGALGRDVFLRGTPGPVAEGPAPLATVGVFNLLDAFAKVLGRAKVKVDHEVSFDRLSISERIQQLCEQLAGKKWCKFEELFEGQRTRFDLVITFLALLEMTRLKMVKLHQAGPLEEIQIELCLSDSILDQASIDTSVVGAASSQTSEEGEQEAIKTDQPTSAMGTVDVDEGISPDSQRDGEAAELLDSEEPPLAPDAFGDLLDFDGLLESEAVPREALDAAPEGDDALEAADEETPPSGGAKVGAVHVDSAPEGIDSEPKPE